MGPRFRAEVALLLILSMGVSSLFVLRSRTPQGPPARDVLAELFRSGDQGLACLKRVVESSGAEARTGLVRTDEVARRVEQVRDLAFDTIPTPTYVTLEELSARAAGFAQEYPDEEAAADGAVLSDLGAVPAGTDVKELTEETLGEQVAGFYDTETKELVVTGDPDAGLDVEEELTLAHEMVHAVTDQRLGIPASAEDPADGSEDAALAATALVEGDATLAMTIYSIEGAFSGSLAGLLGGVIAAGGGADTPHYLARGFYFPYSDGVGFVCRLYEEGGWEAVNAAYASPPTTTAQVIFPERYPEEVAVPPEPSASPGDGWTLADVDGFGAADLLFLFEAPGDDALRGLDHPRERAAAWAGGEVHLWEWRGGLDTATAMVLVEREGERSLCDSVLAWYRAAFPKDPGVPLQGGERLAVETGLRGAAIACAGREVRLGVAQDVATARRLIA